MKHLHPQLHNLRVWLLRRRLRRLGFREVADQVSAETLMRLEMETSHEIRCIFRWFKIGLTAVVILSMWLIFWLRSLEPLPIAVPPPEKASSSPSLPDAIVPPHRNFGEPTLHRNTARPSAITASLSTPTTHNPKS